MASSRQQRKAVQRYHALRSEIDRMPLEMARNMLFSLDRQTIVTGQYASNDGGRCPLYAAFRVGNIESGSQFPHTWDFFCGLPRKAYKRKRECTPHEIRMLRTLLEAKIMPPAERPDPFQEPVRYSETMVPNVMPETAPMPEPQPAVESIPEPQYSCDWDDQLSQLREQSLSSETQAAGSANTAVITLQRTGFIRTRQLD